MSPTADHFWFLNHLCNISFHLSPLGTPETLYLLLELYCHQARARFDLIVIIIRYIITPGVRTDPKLSKQMKEWQDDLEERLKGKEKPPQYWEFPELEKGNIHKHCSKCVEIGCAKDFDWNCPEKPDEKACPVVKCKWVCGDVFHGCKLFEHQIICPK